LNQRLSKEEYYLGIAREVSRRGTCLRRKIGAIIVRDDQIIATGYVGAPRKTTDCPTHDFCMRNRLNIPSGKRYELCRSVHAEMNAIINAARAGVSLLGGDMYVWGSNPDGSLIDAFPCFICKKMIINAGLDRVVCSAAIEGKFHVFTIEEWAKKWREGDIMDDEHQYGQKPASGNGDPSA
jgi:dCMP deaminase